MTRSFSSLAVVLLLLTARAARAQTATLLAASDASQLGEVRVAKVMANDSSLWLSVQLKGKTELALVTAQAAVEPAPAADAWLRALDFATRVRVAPPPGPLASCGGVSDFGLADSGLPEGIALEPKQVTIADSELTLRRALEDAGLPVDPERIARFTHDVEAPFRVALYDVPEAGGDTAALRLLERGNPSGAPKIALNGRESVPINLIALAANAVLPPATVSGDPSEFAVTYRAANGTSDYPSARASWLLDHPTRWLVETQNSSALFAWSVLSPNAQIAPAVTRYFEALSSSHAGSCEAQVQAAYAQRSPRAADYTCEGHDDLAQSLAQLGFGDVRLSRLYGALTADGIALNVAAGEVRSPLLVATDLDRQRCAPALVGTPVAPGSGMPNGTGHPVVVVSDPGSDGVDPGPASSAYTSDGSCNVGIFGSDDSCSGDTSSSEPTTTDSCSGDSSANDSNDSCSGNSSPDDSGPDSCSGNSSSDSSDDSCSGNSDTSSDSSGCSKSDDGYNGDTCTGNAHTSSDATRSTSAELRTGGAPRTPRRRRVHLSLLTLLAAALVLPLRRLRLGAPRA